MSDEVEQKIYKRIHDLLSTEKAAEKPAGQGLELLGQKLYWPQNWMSLVAWCVFCITLVSIFFIVLKLADNKNLTSAAAAIRGVPVVTAEVSTVNEAGKQDGPSAQVLLTFWTPSATTKYDVARERFKVPSEKVSAEQLQAIKSDTPYYYVSDRPPGNENDLRIEPEILDFIKRLEETFPKLQGWSYYDCVGRGTTGFKRGYLWSVALPRGTANGRKQLSKLFSDFWKREKNIYIEELNIAPTYDY